MTRFFSTRKIIGLSITFVILSPLLYYFFYPHFIFEINGFEDVVLDSDNINWQIDTNESFISESDNLLYNKTIYGSPFDFIIGLSSKSPHKLMIKEITLTNVKGNVVFHDIINEDILLTKLYDEKYRGFYCYKNIQFEHTNYRMVILYSLDEGLATSISFELKKEVLIDRCSLFEAGLGI